MNKLKLKYLWIGVAISFVVGAILVFLVTLTEGFWTNFVIVLIAIDFIFMTIAIQIASSRTFKFKPKPINYPKKEYSFSKENIDNKLKKLGYKQRNADYGFSYLKVDGEFAYKIVFVKNNEKYFNQEEKDIEPSNNKDLQKCKKFIGVEIFLDYNDETLKRLPDFCLQGENVYYAGMYFNLETKTLVCPNYIEPSDTFKDLLANIHKDLNTNIIE